MDERDDARREIEVARARLTGLAEELAWRTSPHKIAGDVKERARDLASDAGHEVRRRPATTGLVVAGLAGLATAVLLERRRRARRAAREQVPTWRELALLAARTGRVRGEDLAHDARGRAEGWYGRAEQWYGDRFARRPWLVPLLAAGVVASLFVPAATAATLRRRGHAVRVSRVTTTEYPPEKQIQ